MKIIEELINTSGNKKVEIYRRENGTYGFEALKFEIDEDSWFPYGSFSHGIFESSETAIREAKSRIEWLS